MQGHSVGIPWELVRHAESQIFPPALELVCNLVIARWFIAYSYREQNEDPVALPDTQVRNGPGRWWSHL